MYYCLINSVDVSVKVVKGSTKIVNCLMQESDSCSLIIRDPASAVREGQSVQIYIDTTADMRFSGIITSVSERPMSGFAWKEYNVSAQGYSKVLEYQRVATAYTNQTCAYIINDIITNYVAAAWGITQTNVKTGPIIEEISFNYFTPGDCIRKLCDSTGYYWYVDEDKDLHFFDSETNIAPFEIKDNADFLFSGFQVKPDFSQVRNKVTVEGGKFLSSPISDTFNGDDVTDTFDLTYLASNLTITENAVNKTVGIENITDPTTVDYIMNYWEKTIRRTAGALPSGTTTIATYSYLVKVIVQSEDADAQAACAALEGGDGVHEYRFIDTTIQSLAEAEKTADAEIRKHSYPMLEGGFATYEDGFRAGQLLKINLSSFNFNGTYQIQEVQANSIGSGLFLYQISFSKKAVRIEDILTKIIKKMDATTEDSSEGINIIKSIESKLEFDTVVTIETKNITTNPDTWGAHVDEGTWDFAQWN